MDPAILEWYEGLYDCQQIKCQLHCTNLDVLYGNSSVKRMCQNSFYRPQTKLRQGNVFTRVYHSVHGGVAGRHPPGRNPSSADTPLGRHPLGRHPPWADPPWADTPTADG